MNRYARHRWLQIRGGALWALTFFVLFCRVAPTSASGVEPFLVGPNPDGARLNPYAEILPDPTGTMTTDQVLGDKRFDPDRSGFGNRGFREEVVWIRFRLALASGGPHEVLVEVAYPLLDEVSLTLIAAEGRREFVSGDARPLDDRALAHVNPTFPVQLSSEGPVTVLLRLRSAGSLQFPLQLWSASEHAAHLASRRLLLGTYYGVFLALILVAGLVFAVTRDRSFLLYAGYLASYTLLQFSLNGFGATYFWPFGGELPTRAPPVLAGTSMILMTLFSRSVLGVWPHSQALRALFRGIGMLAGVVVLLGLFGPLSWGGRLAAITALVLVPVMLAAIIFSLRRGVWAARHFLVAWGFFLLGVSVTALTFLGLLPSGTFTTNAMQIGSCLEVWILSALLGERLRALRAQKDAAVASANTYLRQLNEELEVLVAERTRELEDINARLRDIANRDSLTGLLNHRACVEGVRALLQHAVHTGVSIAVIMLDVDHFKRINDHFGHQRGDEILQLVADALMRHIRPSDVCGRYGGEEFLLSVAGISRSGVLALAERLRQEIGRLTPNGFDDWKLTASLGVAVLVPDADTTAGNLIRRADDALYTAKRNGRNRVEIQDDDPPPPSGAMLLVVPC